MKTAEILHNPTAGQEEHTQQQLIESIKAAGFNCRYLSTKDDEWKDPEADTDFFVIAGGDGTIRKLAKSISCNETPNLPVGILPLGTANNVAHTIGLTQTSEQIIDSWHQPKIKKIDTGKVTGYSKPVFFLESFGYSIFPKLMEQMQPYDKTITDAAERKLKAWELLYSLVLATPATDYTIIIDNKDYSGKYIMVEVMNIQSIGPNLQLAPQADPGDGYLDVLLVTENQRGALAAYVEQHKNGNSNATFPLHSVTAQQIFITTDELNLHADDKQIILEKPATMDITISEHQLRFLVTE